MSYMSNHETARELPNTIAARAAYLKVDSLRQALTYVAGNAEATASIEAAIATAEADLEQHYAAEAARRARVAANVAAGRFAPAVRGRIA